MEENKVIEVVDGEVVSEVYEGVSKNNNMIVKLGVAGLGIAAIVGTVIFLKKRKARKLAEAEETVDENETSEVDE